jgi:hypothetical protein
MCVPSEIYAFQGRVNPDAKGEKCHTLTAASTSLFLLKSDGNRAPGLRFSPFLLMASAMTDSVAAKPKPCSEPFTHAALERFPGIAHYATVHYFSPHADGDHCTPHGDFLSGLDARFKKGTIPLAPCSFGMCFPSALCSSCAFICAATDGHVRG